MEKVPKFKSESLRDKYLEEQKAQNEKTRKIYLKIEIGDSPALEKWKKSYK